MNENNLTIIREQNEAGKENPGTYLILYYLLLEQAKKNK